MGQVRKRTRVGTNKTAERVLDSRENPGISVHNTDKSGH
jgi:hypothetical protein